VQPQDAPIGEDALAQDGDLDAPPDAATTCNARWRDGSIHFETPIVVPNINSSVYDRDPYVSADEMTIWFSSGRPGGTGGTVYIAKRTTPTGTFGDPQIDDDFDSAGNETKLSMTEDRLYAVVGSDRTGSAAVDIWESSRLTVNDNWSTPARTNLTLVNSAMDDHDPTISNDGLRLYLAPVGGGQHLAVATRMNVGDPFGAPTTITELVSGMGDADPSPTPDERILLFASNKPGLAGDPAPPNVWYATRAGATGPFDPPKLVPDINTDMPEGDPHLSADGCRIYFARDLGSDNYEIHVATAMP
jgi:hypothetical protein